MDLSGATQKSLDFMTRYLRLEVKGQEHIPSEGKMICIANHSGFAGLDALMLANEIKKRRHAAPKILAHKLWFKFSALDRVQKILGLLKADFNSSIECLNQNEALLLFPEGEAGNFKPSRRRYRLQDFRGGFVRAALITGAPIVPCVIIGAEETNINLGRLKFLRSLMGTDIPLPLNLIPLPIKWTIRFYKPFYIEGLETDALNARLVQKESKKIRHFLQRAIVEELRVRSAFELGKVTIRDDDVP